VTKRVTSRLGTDEIPPPSGMRRAFRRDFAAGMAAALGASMGDELESWDVQYEIVRVLMAGVRTAASRMKSGLAADVHVNDVVSAGYLALAQSLAYWQDGSEEPFLAYATRRASAAMVAAVRGASSTPSGGESFVVEMARVRQSLVDALGPAFDERTRDGSLDTIVSPALGHIAEEEVDEQVA
jgi:hypothetical protein